MAYEQKPNSAVLFPEQKKSDKAPDLKGEANIDGKVFQVSAWRNTSQKTGKVYFSLIFQPKDAAKQYTKPQPKTGATWSDVEDDIPF